MNVLELEFSTSSMLSLNLFIPFSFMVFLCVGSRNLKSRSSYEYVHPQRTSSQIRGLIIVQSKECKYLNVLEDYCGFRKIIRNIT